ncbi:MAG: hypothetical protein Q8Q19_20070 [Microbacterium sp.]|nr:hypothetical protein [Microbacterium sp.]
MLDRPGTHVGVSSRSARASSILSSAGDRTVFGLRSAASVPGNPACVFGGGVDGSDAGQLKLEVVDIKSEGR